MTSVEYRKETSLTLSIREAAELLNVNPRLVSQECKAGTIPSICIGRRRLILRVPFMQMLTAALGA
jgi:excisionase family DNA binding protein